MLSIVEKSKSTEQRRKNRSQAGEQKSGREQRRGTWKQKESIGKGLGLLELLIMVQNVVSKVLILLVAHAGVIPLDTIHWTFWFCFFGKHCKPFSFPGHLEDEAVKSGPGILYCLHFFSVQQQGRILLSEEVFICLWVSVVVITETRVEKILSQSWSLPRVGVGN